MKHARTRQMRTDTHERHMNTQHIHTFVLSPTCRGLLSFSRDSKSCVVARSRNTSAQHTPAVGNRTRSIGTCRGGGGYTKNIFISNTRSPTFSKYSVLYCTWCPIALYCVARSITIGYYSCNKRTFSRKAELCSEPFFRHFQKIANCTVPKNRTKIPTFFFVLVGKNS